MATKTREEIVEIDAQLARMWAEYWTVVDQAEPLKAQLANARKMLKAGYGRNGQYEARVADLESRIRAIMRTAAPLAAAARQFDADNYEGWTRFWTVQDGHIHRPSCFTIRPTTRIGWNYELSGLTEADAVKALGPMLCTHCFPSAPVAWTQGVVDDSKCKGQRDWSAPAREGYYTGNWATCGTCGKRITITSTGKLRAHKA